MHRGDEVAWVGPEDLLRHIVIEMTHHPLGAACCIDDGGALIGLITDGDVRRALQQHDDIRPLKCGDVMTRNPTSVSPSASLRISVELMEHRPSQTSVLPALGADARWLWVIRIPDV